MQKISLIAFVLVLVACSAPSPVIPTAPVTITVPPTITPTSIPTLTETATPVPTETATVVVISSLEGFDFGSLEVGESVRVTDLYGEGSGKFTLLKEEMAQPDQTFELKRFTHKGEAPYDAYTISGLTVVGKRLYHIDLDGNTVMVDGDVIKLDLKSNYNGLEIQFSQDSRLE